ASSSSPRLREKASCSASSTNWSWNTSTAYWSMPSWIAAISGDVSGLPMSMPETSAAKQRPTWRKLMGMDRALPRLAHGRAAVFPRRHRPGARLLREKCEAPAAKRPALCDQGKARKKPRAWGVTVGAAPSGRSGARSARSLLRDRDHVVHAVAGAGEEFLDVACRLADAVLVLHQRNAHKALAVLAKAQSGRDGDVGLLHQQLGKLHAANVAIGLRN